MAWWCTEPEYQQPWCWPIVPKIFWVLLLKCKESYASLLTHLPGQNGHCLTDDIFKCIFLNENVWILIQFSLKFVPLGLVRHQAITWTNVVLVHWIIYSALVTMHIEWSLGNVSCFFFFLWCLYTDIKSAAASFVCKLANFLSWPPPPWINSWYHYATPS